MGVRRERESAFRATGPAVGQIPIAANTRIKVPYPFEEFDLENEYNPVTSTFIPAKLGVYAVMATITFAPTNNVAYSTRIEIHVNGVAEAVDNEFWVPSPGIGSINVISISTILRLQGGDRVEIFALTSAAGNIFSQLSALDINSTHFEAARFPS